MPFKHNVEPLVGVRKQINEHYRINEAEYVTYLQQQGHLDEPALERIYQQAATLVAHVREERASASGIDSFLHQYSLSSEEGIALMCLAEALLRVPDTDTIDALIKDKLVGTDWKAHAGRSKSMFVNATTWALMLTGKLYDPAPTQATKLSGVLKRLVGRTGEGVLRKAVAHAMKIMSKQFVMGRTISEALKRARKREALNYCYSYDMLGEAARTEKDAQRYLKAYLDAIDAIGQASGGRGIKQGPGISVKLSALYARYEVAHRIDAVNVLSQRLLILCQKAKQYDIGLTVDAEEADRLDLSLDIIEAVAAEPSLEGWHGFGLAVQSYQKRAFYVLDWVAQLARKHQRRMMVRLIKGAYWDSEIKRAQMDGLVDYPVFTFKTFTDVSFQACAKKLFTLTDAIYPQFATHNAYSVALIMELAGDYRDFEFQCLHGMGQELYSAITPPGTLNIPCRIYAPVGTHEDLLPYLVRRLLENGANSSFVNRIVDDSAPVDSLIEAPLLKANRLINKIGEAIPAPCDIFGKARLNAKGFDVSDHQALVELSEQMSAFGDKKWCATPMVASNLAVTEQKIAVYAPFDRNRHIGYVTYATSAEVEKALEQAACGFKQWSELPVVTRARCLTTMADLLEQQRQELYALLMLEAGKVLNDAIAEVREAIDFCRYYALQAIQRFGRPIQFDGYTGETNSLVYHGRGTLLCISPWNFPLAIFLGQITASLVAGNCVIAKPAEQTSLIAAKAVELLHQAGVPPQAIQLLPGEGATVGAQLVADPRIAGVLFTGSTQTARFINQALANRVGPIVPLIAETGGQNAMIVDSSALLEQVIRDALMSSFGSAGQRCSALRVIYVQEEIYVKFKEMLVGAMALLKIGSPYLHQTDIGPVIDNEALANLQAHVDALKAQGKLLYQVPLAEECKHGYFLAPCAFEIASIKELDQEYFGPILHVIRYRKRDLDVIMEEINGTGYGLTLGIHSRVEETVKYIATRMAVGNCYVNRNMTGAIVGLQPFGGEGLSGTGPKAGGPNYLMRLCHERTLTVDTTAAGGNASLMSKSLE